MKKPQTELGLWRTSARGLKVSVEDRADDHSGKSLFEPGATGPCAVVDLHFAIRRYSRRKRPDLVPQSSGLLQWRRAEFLRGFAPCLEQSPLRVSARHQPSRSPSGPSVHQLMFSYFLSCGLESRPNDQVAQPWRGTASGINLTKH